MLKYASYETKITHAEKGQRALTNLHVHKQIELLVRGKLASRTSALSSCSAWDTWPRCEEMERAGATSSGAMVSSSNGGGSVAGWRTRSRGRGRQR
jgi:hypothetical protein